MPPLIFRGRAAGYLAKDAVKLRVAAEASIERGFKQSALPAGAALKFITVEEPPHALAVAELDDGEPSLLFEKTAET